MKVIILTLFMVSCSLVQCYQVQYTTYEGFDNQCASEVQIPSFVRVSNTSKQYYIEETTKRCWFGAAHFCRSMDANLVSIETNEEYDALSQFLLSKGVSMAFWTGANDLSETGQFQWIKNGKQIENGNWESEQRGPPRDGNEHCVALYIDPPQAEYYMRATKCGEKTLFICEANIPKTIAISIW